MPIEDHRLLVTDITEYGVLRCVAGWDLDRQTMIRPEPRPGDFWPAAVTGPGAIFRIGALVQFAGQRPEPPTAYPHFTEDRVVVGLVMPSRIVLSAAQRSAALVNTLSVSIPEIFDGHLQRSGNLKGFVA